MINESHNLFHICFETWCYMTTLNGTVTIPGIESNTNVLSVLFLVAACSLVLGILLIEKWQSISKSFVISGMFLGTVTRILSNETVYSTHWCRAITQSMVLGLYVSLYSRTIQWHIHAGSWSLVNCWREGSTLPYIGCSWVLMNAAVGHMNGSALMVIGVSAWYPDIPLSPWKKRLCLHAKKLLLEIYDGP